MVNIYEDVFVLDDTIPELKGWRLTKGLNIKLEDKFYYIWDPKTDKHTRLYRGTHSCGWGWGALLAPEKSSLVNSAVSIAYPLIGMAYGLKEKIKSRLSAET